MAGWEIRTAGRGDLKAIEALYCDLHAPEPYEAATDAADIFDRILQAPDRTIFLLEEAGVPTASCYLVVADNLTRGGAPFAIIENVVVAEARRRRGLGRAILHHALEAAWARGCYKVMLLTGRAENIPFYEACGFSSTNKRGLVARCPQSQSRG